MMSDIKTSLFKKNCHSVRKDYFCCHVISKYAPHLTDLDDLFVWSFASLSYAEVSRFASMFSYIPDADIYLSCVHFNK